MHRPTKRQTPAFASLRPRPSRRSQLRSVRTPVKDLSSSAEADLDFRNLIQEIDQAMQRRLDHRTSLPGEIRDSQRQSAVDSPWKDELYQYIAHLPEDKGKQLRVERVGGMAITSSKGTKASIEVQTRDVQLQTTGSQTEETALSVSNAKLRVPSKRSQPGLRESASLASIRQLLASAPAPPQRRAEVVLTEDCPTLSLSSLFQTRRKQLYLRMQARASSLSPKRTSKAS